MIFIANNTVTINEVTNVGAEFVSDKMDARKTRASKPSSSMSVLSASFLKTYFFYITNV